MPTLFIAEVSSNHAQDLGRALAFIDAAAEAGCDAVKFQLFTITRMFAPEILAQSPQHRARAAWELPEAFLPHLAARAAARGVFFACTPFDLGAVAALAPHVAFFKIASYELLHSRLIAAAAATGKPLVLSSGMATLPEIRAAVATARRAGAQDVTVLHCVSAYPAPVEEANLKAIETLRVDLGVPVGWSDHTVSPGVLQRAIHRWGAAAIEFHLDLDGKGAEFAPGHCWLPHEIARVIAEVRAGERADGTGEKAPAACELPDRDWRADPLDGMRPLRRIRASWRPQ